MNLQRLHLDKPLLIALLAVFVLSLLAVYSASGTNLGFTAGHALRLSIGFVLMLAVAQLRPEMLARWSPYLYIVAMIALILVLFFGSIGKGAQRWLNLGIVRFQPSELMKLALPMMLAWYFARGDLPPGFKRLAAGLVIVLVPVAVIAEQPDLGTAILVLSGGAFVLFLAGMRWSIIVAVAVAAVAAAPVAWNFMHDYQRHRVLTLLDPQSDPLGTGYHTIQSMIAVGSGGFYGKGWGESSQAHLEYLPEAPTDFVFAVFAEEFGLLGGLVLLGLLGFIALRTLLIAFYAQDVYARLLAGGLGLIFFLSVFVNVGMVIGVLPIVGVPLPIVSFGGTSVVTTMVAFGIVMSIHTHRRIVQ